MCQNPSELLFSIWVLFFLHPILVDCLSLDLNNRSVHSISIHPSNNNIICLEKDHHLKCSNGNRWVFTRYSESNGEVIERNMLQDKKMPTGMVSVTMSGFPCLAVSYRQTITTVSPSSHFSVIAILNYEFVEGDKITSET